VLNIKTVHIYFQWNSIPLIPIQWNIHKNVILSSRDPYMKWNKSGTDRHMPCDFIHTWTMKKFISQKLRAEWCLSEAREGNGKAEIQRCWSMFSKLQLRVRSSGLPLYNRMAINTYDVVHISKSYGKKF
jgi:hypothetical protein